MTGVILQPSYVPWRGYFHLIQRADVFVFLDDVQYTQRDWRNRNILKGPQGPQWITVPVVTKGRRLQSIMDVEIDNSTNWRREHLAAIRRCYARAPYFSDYIGTLETQYGREWKNLCELDIELTQLIAQWLGLDTRFVRSSDLDITASRTQRLVGICKRLGVTRYISGPSGRSYIDEAEFEREQIELVYHSYDYPEYSQSFGAFLPHVTAIDLLCNCGDRSAEHIWASDGDARERTRR